MTNLKDKLSASVRQAKDSRKQLEKTPVAKPAEAAPAVSKPAATKPAPKKNAARPAPAVGQSGSALFPDRVWPD